MSKRLIPLNPPYYKAFQSLRQQRLNNPSCASLHLQFGEFKYFECSQCGECCRHPWELSVSEAFYTHWQTRFKASKDERMKAPFQRVKSPSAERYAVFKRQSNGACFFLNPDNTCYVHQNYGESTLPILCQSYPRQQHYQGEGITVLHLLQSCIEVPEALTRETQLYYYFEPLIFNVYSKAATFEWPFDKDLLYSWYGLVLDAWERPQTPLIILRQIFSILYAIWNQKNITEDQLFSLFQEAKFSVDGSPGPNEVNKNEFFDLYATSMNQFAPFLVALLKEMKDSSYFEVGLLPTEQKILNQFMNQYCRRQAILLIQSYSFSYGLNILQSYALNAQIYFLIQLTALIFAYEQEMDLNLGHLSAATQMISVYFVQNHSFIKGMGFDTMTAERVNAHLMQYLALDMGRTPVGWYPFHEN